MRTVIDNLQEMADGIRYLLEDLLLNQSSMYMWNRPGGPFVVVSARGDYAFHELGDTGRQIQAKLLEEYRRFHSLLSVLLREQPKDSLKSLSDSDGLLRQTIEQETTSCKNTREALGKAVEALQAELGLLQRLYDPSGGVAVFIPDTNALLYNPNLEAWAFEGNPQFTLVLVPTVLSELDNLKVGHRNEAVMKKAETIIRRIKEYGRRGRLTEGVPVVKGTIDLVAIATEPDMKATLPWLDPDNNDDRFLASDVEVMRDRARAPVVIVTRDINLQNKAAFARLPFAEPPEPAE